MKDGAGGPGSVVEVGAQALGDGQDPLAHRDIGGPRGEPKWISWSNSLTGSFPLR